jgi:hypothetical protein
MFLWNLFYINEHLKKVLSYRIPITYIGSIQEQIASVGGSPIPKYM